MRLSKARKEIVTTVVKDTIAEAAGAVLEQYGVNEVTMERVATKAGLTAGNLYNYFRNKDELMRFVFARLVVPFFVAIEDICHAALPAPEKLARIVDMVAMKQGTEQKGLIRLLADFKQRSLAKKSVHPRLTKIFAELFEDGIVEGSFRPHTPTHAGRLFAGALAELFDLRIDGASSDEVTEYIRFMKDVVFTGLSVAKTEP